MRKKVVISPDSYKGSISAADAASAIALGVLAADPDTEVLCIPIADGGEGTLEALTSPSDRFPCASFDANGRPIQANIGRIGDCAVIEIAQSVGLCLVPQSMRDPLNTTSKGVGSLILSALDAGFEKLLLTVGGSGSNDGGVGMLSELGAEFFDVFGNKILDIRARDLERIDKIDISGLDRRLYRSQFTLACDVINPLLGPMGATYVFGPQKGADGPALDRLESGMKNYARCIAEISKDASSVPGTGAGGGLPTPLVALFDTQIRSGIESVLASLDYENKIKDADLIISGEGRMDYQSAYGKAVGGVAALAKKHAIPVLALVGSVGERADDMLSFGVSEIFSISELAPSTEYSISHASELLTLGAERAVKKYISQKQMRK